MSTLIVANLSIVATVTNRPSDNDPAAWYQRACWAIAGEATDVDTKLDTFDVMDSSFHALDGRTDLQIELCKQYIKDISHADESRGLSG